MPTEWQDLIDLSGVKDRDFVSKIEQVLDFRFSLPDGRQKLEQLEKMLDSLQERRRTESGHNILSTEDTGEYKVQFIERKGDISYTDHYGTSIVTLDPDMLKKVAYVDVDLQIVPLTLNRVIEHELLGHGLDGNSTQSRDVITQLSYLEDEKYTKFQQVVEQNIENIPNVYRAYSDTIEELKAFRKEMEYATLMKFNSEQMLKGRDILASLENQEHVLREYITNITNNDPRYENMEFAIAFEEYIGSKDGFIDTKLNHIEYFAVEKGNTLESQTGTPDRNHYMATITLSEPLSDVLFYTSIEQAKSMNKVIDEPLSEAEKMYFKRLNDSKDDHEIAQHSPKESAHQIVDDLIKDNPELKQDILTATAPILNPESTQSIGPKTEMEIWKEENKPPMRESSPFER